MDEKSLNKSIRSAIKLGNSDEVKRLLEGNPQSLHAMTAFGTWLHMAARTGQMELVEYLVHQGIDVNTKGDIFDASPLRLAARAGHLEIVKYLIENGATLDVSLAKRNPLFGAIYGGHKEVAELLVEKGIDISIKYTGESIKNMSAYDYAKEFGQTEIADYLKRKMIERGAEVNDPAHENEDEDEDVILAQMAKHFGSVKNSIGEIIPGSKVAVTIHIIPSSEEHPFTTLFTTGMSDESMGYSIEEQAFKYAELLLKLPSDWPVEQGAMDDPAHFWPLTWLRQVAHIPHLYDGGL
ncbi:ankyrin repeat family protein, partial [Fictibacillus macauensis ZFHKF-1]